MDYKPYIDLLSAALAPLIAIVTSYIAIQQYRANKTKLKHDLFERRWSVYKTVMETIGHVMREGDISDEQLLRFNIERINGFFLFNDKLSKYLDDLYSNLVHLQGMNNMTVEEKAKNAKKRTELMEWFYAQINVTRTAFKKSMRLS